MGSELDFAYQFVPGSSGRTLLMLHGTGGDEHDLLPLGRELDPTANLLSPRGKVLENGSLRFFRRLAEGVFDLEDLQRRTRELAEFIRRATEHYQLAPEQIVAVGYSNGANIAANILLRQPGTLPSAVLLRAMAPSQPETLPDLTGVRVWIAGGRDDALIPSEETQRLADLLEKVGADVTLHLVNADHGLTNTELVLAKRWLATL
ncbi:MAG: alpha/beta hydrolase [Chthoniobacterales bacterium]